MVVKDFEDLRVWQDARVLANRLFKLFGESRDFTFRDQILRSGISVMNNIAEGFDRYSKTEFKRFLQFSLASCSEVKSMLYLAIDFNYITGEEASELMALCMKIKAGIMNLIKSLKLNKDT